MLGNGRCHRGVLGKAGKLSWGGWWVGLHVSNQFLLDWVSIKRLCRIILFLIVLKHIKFTSTEKNVIRVVCKSGLIGIGGRGRLEKTQKWGVEEETVTAILGEGWGGSDSKDSGADTREASFINEHTSITLLFICYGLANRKKC